MKKIVAIFTVLVVAIVSTFLLMGGCEKLGGSGGDGNGGSGSGEGSGGGTTSSASAEGSADVQKESSVEESEQSKIQEIEITVSGRDYLYQNNKIDLEDLMKELVKLGKDTQINIKADDTAAINTIDDLTDRLDEEGFKNYTKKTE